MFANEQNTDDCCNIGKYFELSYEQKFYGFVIFSVIGILLSVIGSMLLFSMNLTGFGLTYSIGNICMIFATLFLFGFIKQFKRMVSSLHRTIAVLTYFSTIILTIVSALVWKNVGLCIIFLILQVCAYLWYTITSIPGGQTMCKHGCQIATGI